MLRASKTAKFPLFASLGKGSAIPLGMFFLVANTAVTWAASDGFGSNSSPSSNLLISQNEDIPEVVIDENPNDSSTSSSTVGDTRFTCEMVNGQYTVMYHPESQPGQAYPWAVPSQMGGGWSPQRRCGEITRRLESYRPDGLLELTTSVENNYNILCVTTQKVPGCRIVLTVPPGQDPVLTRDRVFQNLTIADSGQQTQGVNTFVDKDNSNQILNQIGQILNQDLSSLVLPSQSDGGIDLRPFLDPSDGGTGTQLQPGKAASPSSSTLNPDKFR